MNRKESPFECGGCKYSKIATRYSNYGANLREVWYQNEKKRRNIYPLQKWRG
jgi:hypothetical protein